MLKQCWCTYSLLCAVLLGVSAGSTARTLELVTLEYPPYAYQQDDKVEGIAVRVVEEVFQRMRQPVTITVLPWARALQRIQQGRSDGIFTAYKTVEREVFADYSKEVLIPQTVSLFVKGQSGIRFDGDLKSLHHYQFGVVRKVSYGSVFDSALNQGVFNNVQIVDSGQQNFRKLILGRVDIVVSNKYGAYHILNQIDGAEKVRELTPELQSLPSYIAFSKKRALTGVRDRFDHLLREIKADGTYDRIINQYY